MTIKNMVDVCMDKCGDHSAHAQAIEQHDRRRLSQIVAQFKPAAIYLGEDSTSSTLYLAQRSALIGAIGGTMIFASTDIGIKGDSVASVMGGEQVRMDAGVRDGSNSGFVGTEDSTSEEATVYAVWKDGATTKGASISAVADSTSGRLLFESTTNDSVGDTMVFRGKTQTILTLQGFGDVGIGISKYIEGGATKTRGNYTAGKHEFFGPASFNNVPLFDFIKEHTEADGWKIDKYKSGKVVLLGYKVVNTTCPYDNRIWISDQYSIVLPLTLASADSMDIKPQNDAFSCIGIEVTGGNTLKFRT